MRKASLLRLILFTLGFATINLGQRVLSGVQVASLDVAWNLLGGFILALQFLYVFSYVMLKRGGIITVTLLVLFVIFSFNNMLEAYFFTELFSSISVFVVSTIVSFLMSIVEAVLAGVLFLPRNPKRELTSELREYLRDRPLTSQVWRVLLASLAFFPIYLTFGALISPFIIPYYSNQSLGLKIPPFTVIAPLEFFRGFLYIVSLLPIIALFKKDRKKMFAVVVSLLYIPGAFVPLIIQPSLPANIIPFHMIEILADSIVYGGVITLLLSRRNNGTKPRDS